MVVTGRKPSEEEIFRVYKLRGMIILLSLMLYAMVIGG
jgi:hypothetical protein